MKTQHIAAGIVLLAVIAGGAFYGGMQYEKSVAMKTLTANRGAFGGNRQGGTGTDQGGQRGAGQNDGRRGGGFVAGEILSKDDKSLTIKTPDGGSTIVYFTDTLSVRKAETGSLSDLATGEQVMVNGKANSDGSVAADTVSISLTPAK
jgi:hypothetical protein